MFYKLKILNLDKQNTIHRPCKIMNIGYLINIVFSLLLLNFRIIITSSFFENLFDL